MKQILTLALAAVIATGVNAEEKKDSVNKNKPVFTVVKENKITSIRTKAGVAPAGLTPRCRSLKAKF